MAVGDPIGDDLCSGTTDGDTLPLSTGSYEEREITLGAGCALISGTQYAIVVRALSASTNNSLVWSCTRPGTYTNGENFKSLNSGVTWFSPSYDAFVEDQWFTTKALIVEKDSYKGAYTLGYGFGKVVWWAQSFTAGSSYTITSVVLKLAKVNGTTPGIVTVSIKATESDLPSKPINPTPTDAADDITLDQQTISWEDGGGATSYDVYYGTTSGNLTLLESGVTDTEYTIFEIDNGSPFDYEVTRYWRIDAVNDAGTTTGDEWSFTTIVFKVPAVGPRGFSDEADGFGGGTIADGEANIKTRLVAFTRNKVFYEDT